MTVNLYDGSAGLFDVLGKVFHSMGTAITAIGTTVDAEVLDIVTQHENVADNLVLNAIIARANSAQNSLKTAGEASLQTLQALAREYLIEVVDQDVGGLQNRNFVAAITEIRDQMETASESMDASAVTASIASSPSGTDKGKLVVTQTRGDGLVQEFALAETITLKDSTGGGDFVASSGATETPLSIDWPGKSGATASVTPSLPSSGPSKLGNFDTLDTNDELPKDWIPVVGTVGTSMLMTTPEQQTLTVSGTPTGGYYRISWVDADSNTQTTAPIAWNASGSAVRTALRKLTGLEKVTVSSSGTSPDFTHTVTFVGQGGNVSQFTITNSLTGGTSPTVTPATTVAGTAQVYDGTYALHLAQPGSELTELCYRLSGLKPETCYAVNAFLTAGAAIASGVIQFSLRDGVGGSVINSASESVNCSDLTTSWQGLAQDLNTEPVFRTPATVPDLVYLTIRFSVAPPASSDVYIDQVAILEMTELYPGGPLAAIFSGRKPFVVDDKFTVTVTNDRAGLLHEWIARTFDLPGNGILLPVDSGGTETIPDTVVS